MSDPLQRFVSLAGFFALEYPAAWQQETDAAGHYLFYNNNGGSGVLRVLLLENEFTGDDAPAQMEQEILKQNRDFDPQVYQKDKNRFIHFVKAHEVNGGNFTVYYWAITQLDKVLLFTFTLQSALKALPTALLELEQVEQLIASLQWLHETAHHGNKPA